MVCSDSFISKSELTYLKESVIRKPEVSYITHTTHVRQKWITICILYRIQLELCVPIHLFNVEILPTYKDLTVSLSTQYLPLSGTCRRNLAVIVHSPILWPLNLQTVCICTWTNSKWTLSGPGFFSSTFLFTLGGKKFIYNNNLANLQQNTCMCMLFIFTQSKKWLTT